MKNLTKRIFILMLFVSIAMFSITTVSASVVSTTQTHASTDEGIQIEEKYKKVSKNKITFNANGGKVGSKKTFVKNVNKGAKISKFPASPKRAGYAFKGWYTKKVGGTKIDVNTKPTKSVSYYAQWKKGNSRVLNVAEKKLVGTWWRYNPYNYKMDTYSFSAEGKFSFVVGDSFIKSGNYNASSGKITFTNIVKTRWAGEKINYPNKIAEYRIDKRSDGKGDILIIASLDYDKTYLPLSFTWDRWYKTLS